MDTIRQFASDVEVYSCDESFVRPIDGLFGNYQEYGQQIKKAIWKQVRIPVGVGIAQTKTLAKLANKAAKKIPKLNHVCVLEREDQREWLLRKAATKDVWGVGSRTSKRLADMGIHTAWDLANANTKHLRTQFNVTLERTVEELNGVGYFAIRPIAETPKSTQIKIILDLYLFSMLKRYASKVNTLSIQSDRPWELFW